MIINKARGKNFFSFGNAFVELDLAKSRRTVLTGTNGVGKSSILNLVSFGLFGKTIKPVTKGQIVNSINGKNCICEIEFTENGSEYLVRRGIKPNVFEIYENGILLDQTLVGDYQDYLEQKIIKCSHRTFMQTSIISIENYKPFMSLSKGDRREFIEDILDIKVFSVMNQLVKSEISKTKESIKVKSTEYDNLKNSLLLKKRHIDQIDSIRSSGIESIQTRIDSYSAQVTQLEQSIQSKLVQLSEAESTLELLSKKQHEANEVKLQMSALQPKIKQLDSTMQSMKSKVGTECTQCLQEVPHTHADEVVQKYKSSYDELVIEYKQLHSAYSAFSDVGPELTQVSGTVSNLSRSIHSDRSTISTLTREKESGQSEIKKIQEADDTTELKAELKADGVLGLKMSNDISELKTELEYSTTMLELFKDTGVKSKIVDQYVPVINKLVNEYLEKLDFFVSFNLDSEFTETIKSRHRDDFTYSSFSAGERQRIDMALLFTFRQIAKLKNSFSTNLLLLDEILDASLDDGGIQNLITIFESPEFDSTNLFVISHRNGDVLGDAFDDAFRVYKESGFTQIEKSVI